MSWVARICWSAWTWAEALIERYLETALHFQVRAKAAHQAAFHG